MTTNNILNKSTALSANQKVSQGVDKYFSKVKSLTLEGKTYSPKGLKDVLEAENTASEAVDTTKAQYQQQVADHRAAKAKAQALRKALRGYIVNAYGSAAIQMLGDFGMVAPKSTGRKTAASKALAVEKAKATREARETMGKDQKKSIHGAPLQQAAPADAQGQGAPGNTPAQVAPGNAPVQMAPASQPAQLMAPKSS